MPSNSTIFDPLRLILVAVQAPEETRPLLELALSFYNQDGSNITVLHVSPEGAEKESQTLAELHSIVEDFTDQGYRIKVSTTRSTSSSRGILDVARENRAGLLVLGIAKPSRADVSLGPVAESVLPAAPCPVLLFRPGETTEYERVVIPVTGSPHARFTSRLAMSLAQQQDLPVSALLVHEKAKSKQDPEDASPDYWQDRGLLEAALVDIPGEEAVNRLILHAPDAVTGFLSELKVNDIAVVGFSDRGQWQRWIHGDVPVALLKKWKGPLVIASGAAEKTLVTGRIAKLRSWLTPTLTLFEKEEIVRDARESAYVSLDYIVLIIVSAVLASFGLLLNSSAVIIGAMLVAPLMLPLIAFSTGMTIGKIRLVRSATGTLLQGILAAFFIAFIVGWITRSNTATPEMLSRGNPSFLDLGVAFASGFLGAYATARKNIPSALAGVAIAAALMPPLCTVGLAVAMGNQELWRGSTLLFLSNIVGIILAAWATFIWLGMRPAATNKVEQQSSRRTSAILVVLLLLILIAMFIQN